jgi:8-oxo-dGTP pyrophosphatase MutT (NUDIX family)
MSEAPPSRDGGGLIRAHQDRLRDEARQRLADPSLDREALRARLQEAASSLGGSACLPLEEDSSLFDGPGPDLAAPALPGSRGPAEGVPAAVLIGLLAHPEGPGVILTRRTAHLKNHPAQISLPGGRIEAGDSGAAAAALREAFEEIGLAPDKVELLGCLPPHMTVSGFLVHPFVGWVEPPLDFVLDAHEVAEVFEVPLAFVLDSKNHLRDSLVVDGLRRSFYVLPYPGHRIWGATAGILVSLARVLGPRAASAAQ